MELLSLKRTLDFVRSQGAQRIALCYWDRLPVSLSVALRAADWGVSALIQADGLASGSVRVGNLPVLSPTQAESFTPLDAIVVVDRVQFAWILRYIERVLQRDLLVLPATKDWVVPSALTRLDAAGACRESVPAEYLARSGLGGHYLEFGAYWGRSFFPAYFRYRHLLKGRFYAFDSFAGLSQPSERETLYTGGDFRPRTYNFNLRSFLALASLLGVDPERLRVVPGFYSETLAGRDPFGYGLEPKSVSVCVIDCDLYEPTAQALHFVTPLLEPGCLLYFDDWRLCRASAEVGERAAALAWLKSHPNIELVELHRTHWQHQWFIFNG
jgi:hypothetical protein